MNRNRLIAHIAANPQVLVAWFEARGLGAELEALYQAKYAPSDEEQAATLARIRQELEDIGYGGSEIARNIGLELGKKRQDIELRMKADSPGKR